MQKLNSGHWTATISMPEELKDDVTEYVENNPEMNVSRLFREAVRKELQRREINE